MEKKDRVKGHRHHYLLCVTLYLTFTLQECFLSSAAMAEGHRPATPRSNNSHVGGELRANDILDLSKVSTSEHDPNGERAHEVLASSGFGFGLPSSSPANYIQVPINYTNAVEDVSHRDSYNSGKINPKKNHVNKDGMPNSIISPQDDKDLNKKKDEKGEGETLSNFDPDYYTFYNGEDYDYAYNYEDFKLPAEDVTLLEDISEEYPLKPEIGKCCLEGEALNAQGICKEMTSEHRVKLHHWFPQAVLEGESLVPVEDMSEWKVTHPHHFECAGNESLEIVEDRTPEQFTYLPDGSLLLPHKRKILDALTFCADLMLGYKEGRVIKGCFTNEDICDTPKCLKKCCPQDSIINTNETCVKHRQPNDVHNFQDLGIEVVHTQPTCEFGSYEYAIEDYNISDSGDLVLPDGTHSFDSYCLEYFLRTPEEIENDKKDPLLKAFLCFKSSNEADLNKDRNLIEIGRAMSIITGVGLIISAAALLVAAIISWKLPELRSLHGKCQLCHLLTLFLYFLQVGIIKFTTKELSPSWCHFFAVFIHICALSAFLWLNLLCINIYLTFRSLRPPLAARSDENKRLALLCLYGWGIPAIFCLTLYTLDRTVEFTFFPKPEYGYLKCLLSNRGAEFLYLFAPIGALLLCNGALFCLTARELLFGVWRLENSDSINFRRKSMGVVIGKLGFVMGISWVLDVISWAVGPDHAYIFYAADIFNSFQGVFICIILIWRKRVLEVLHLRKPSIIKEETLTARPFLQKNSTNNVNSVVDQETSLVSMHES